MSERMTDAALLANIENADNYREAYKVVHAEMWRARASEDAKDKEIERLKADAAQRERVHASDIAVLREYADRWKAAEVELTRLRARVADLTSEQGNNGMGTRRGARIAEDGVMLRPGPEPEDVF